MTKEVKAKPIIASVNAVTKAFNDAYDSMAKSASLVHIVYKVCKRVYKGKAIPAADRAAILKKLTLARKWTKDSARPRCNEADSVMKAYATFPELARKFAAKTPDKSVSWHQAVSLCRAFNKLGDVKKAVAKTLLTKAAPIAPEKLTRAAAKAKVAAAIKTILRMKNLEPKFRHGLAELCESHSVNV